MDIVNQWLKSNPANVIFNSNEFAIKKIENPYIFLAARPVIECKDGFKVSVQVGETTYCSPKKNFAESYTHVELGFPSGDMLALKDYKEDKEKSDTKTVFGYVPVGLVCELIELHGGIKSCQ